MGKKARKEDFYGEFFQGVCHRGLHDETKTENGLEAFKAAIENGFAFELDIHLTKDNELLVCHDSDLKRTTGKEGIIEDLTLEEIKKNYRLLDGEEVPTLEEVLALNREKETIVVELKPYKLNHKALAKKTVEVLDSVKDKKKITLISFDPRALLALGKVPYKKGLLLADSRKDILPFRHLFDYLDVEDKLLDHPKIIQYRKKGNLVNVWTIRSLESMKSNLEKCDTMTWELLPVEEVRNLLGK